MARTVTATEAKNRLGAVMRWANDHGEEVIVEQHGKPAAVIMPIAAYRDLERLREDARRAEARAMIRAARAETVRRNLELTEEEAMALADRAVREVFAELVAEGKLVFDSDGA